MICYICEEYKSDHLQENQQEFAESKLLRKHTNMSIGEEQLDRNSSEVRQSQINAIQSKIKDTRERITE